MVVWLSSSEPEQSFMVVSVLFFYRYIYPQIISINMNQRVARGRVFQVDNMDRKFGENPSYNFVFFEDTRDANARTCEDGEQLPTEYPLLFTDNEIQVARQRALRNKEDLLEKDFITDLTDDLF